MPGEVKELIQEYEEGKITRRDFIVRAAVITGSLAAANTLVDSLLTPPLHAAQVDPNDPELSSENVQFPGAAGTVYGYQSRPKQSGTRPAIIIIHEWNGLNDHVRDVARRFAKEGFLGLAPDYLSRHGGTAKVPGAGRGLRNIRELAPLNAVKEETEAAVSYLRARNDVRADRIGITGFCWGGGGAFYAATQIRGFRAVVVFYGSSPNPLDLVQHIEAPVLGHYGELDQRITGRAAQTSEVMAKYGKSFEYKIYPGAGHAFHSDTNPASYHPEAAKEAWGRTLEFFNQHLKD